MCGRLSLLAPASWSTPKSQDERDKATVQTYTRNASSRGRSGLSAGSRRDARDTGGTRRDLTCPCHSSNQSGKRAAHGSPCTTRPGEREVLRAVLAKHTTSSRASFCERRTTSPETQRPPANLAGSREADGKYLPGGNTKVEPRAPVYCFATGPWGPRTVTTAAIGEH